MANIICTGDYTITDFNDAISLSGYIGANLPHTQIYSPDNESYTPDWSDEGGALILTPELYVTSTTANVITSSAVTKVTWYKDAEKTPIATGGEYSLSGAKSHILTINKNILADVNSVKFICVVDYLDSTTGLKLKHKMDITFTLVESGSGIADALALCPEGNVFKNGTIASLTATCDLYRGSTIDTTDVKYQWYKKDTSASTGWTAVSGATTHQLTVKPSDVPNVVVYKCVITDGEGKSYFDTVTFTDLSDPIQLTIVSTGGDTFKNGNGSTTLTARLFQAGKEIDTNTQSPQHVYKWYKYDKDGNLVKGYGGTNVDYKTGKTLAVSADDVDTKATFRCEVE